MEAAPKLPLLSFQLKTSPEQAEFSSKLKQHIGIFYNEDPEAYNKEIRELENMRQSACRVQMDFTGCGNLKKYYAQLQLLKKRFPMTEDGAASVMFVWSDIYSGATMRVTDIKQEQACILHNIGALHSKLGAMDNRQTSEGMKISCTHFQCAAWAFQHLRDHPLREKSLDMSQEILSFYIAAMLGQAQECILEKSMLDNRKSTIIAKIAAQIVDYYRQALKALDSEVRGADSSNSSTQVVDYYKQALKALDIGPQGAESIHISAIVGVKVYKHWRKYLEFKIAYYHCITYLFMGNQAEELQKMGEKVAYFQGALEKLNESGKLAKGLEKEFHDALTFTMDVVGGKFNAASKENEFVYHEKVPALDSLPEIKGASLVKGIPFDPADPEILERDIFARLVPMEAHERSSLYSEEKAQILRNICTKIEEKDQELIAYLSSLQLEDLNVTPEANTLPQELVDCCAALSVRPNAIKDLVVAMQSLSSIYHDVDGLLNDIEGLLEEEANQEKKCQELMGKRPPSMIILEIKKELGKYKEAHQKASDSNVTLHKAMDYHITNLNLLSGSLDELTDFLPSIDALDTPNNLSTRLELQRLRNRVEDMKIQRQMLEQQLREQLQSDDITKQLVTNDGLNSKELFAREIQKHDRQISYINQNLTAQEKILKALTEVNASYADTRRAINEIAYRRKTMIQNLITTYEAYEDLASKSQKGLDFYRKLEESATKLLQRTRSVCKVQEEERASVMKQVKKVTIDRPTVAKPPAAVAVASGPKLKDYLQFMKPGTGGQLRLPAADSGPAPLLANASRALYQPTSTEGNIANSQAYSSQYEHPGAVLSSQYEPELSLPSELRPPPVGSEQADIPQSFCSTSRGLFSETGKITSLADYSRKSAYNSSAYGYGDTARDFKATYGHTADGTFDDRYAGSQTDSSFYSSSRQYTSSGINQYPAAPAALLRSQQFPYQSAGLTHQDSNGSYQQSTGGSTWHPGLSRGSSHFPESTSVYTAGYQFYPGYNSVAGTGPPVPQAQLQNTGTVEGSYGQSSGYSSYVADNYGAPMAAPAIASIQSPTPLIQQQTQSAISSFPSMGTNIPGSYSTSVSQQVHAPTPCLPTAGNPSTAFPYASVVDASIYSQNVAKPQRDFGDGVVVTPQYSIHNQYEIQPHYPPGHNQSTQNSYLPMQQPLQPQIPSTATSMHIQPPSEKSMLSMPSQSQPSNPNDTVALSQQPRRDSNLDILQQLDFSASELQCQEKQVPPADSKHEKDDTLAGNAMPSEQQMQILIPKVLNVNNITKEKDHEVRKAVIKDPFLDKETLDKFVVDVERFQKVVEGLSKQSLNGPTPLEQKWKELMDTQDRESKKLSISVARCCSMKNRMPDIMPYDNSRVIIATLKDDYINASYLKNLSKNTVQYIAAQAPLTSTYRDFWVMIYEQQTEVMAAVISDVELKGDIYWPSERGQVIDHDTLTISLQCVKKKAWGVERLILITQRETRSSRAVIHLQFTGWSPGGIPSSPSQFLQFVADVHAHNKEQRNASRPIVVHCSAGIGRTGVFCLVSAAIHEVNAGSGIVDLWSLAARMTQMRKYIMQDKEHMRFCFHAVLYYAEDCLLKRGILIKRASFDDKVSGNVSHKSSHTRHPSQDFILGPAHDDQQQTAQTNEAGVKSVQSLNPPIPVPSKMAEPSKEAFLTDSEKASGNNTRSRSNSNASSASSSQGHQHTCASPQHQSQGVGSSCLPPSLANLDAAHFTLEPMVRKTKKITKDSFTSQGGRLGEQTDPNDPLSQLDPLWSLHK